MVARSLLLTLGSLVALSLLACKPQDGGAPPSALSSGTFVTIDPAPDLGIRLGAPMNLGSHGFLGYAFQSSRTLGDAFDLVVRFVRTRTSLLDTRIERQGNRAALVLEERYRPRMGWKDWFAQHGIHLPRQPQMLRFNDYSIVLQAALEGQGVALGWKHIVEPLLAQGQLVRPLPEAVTTDQPLHVVAPRDTELRSDVAHLKNWLMEEAKTGSEMRHTVA